MPKEKFPAVLIPQEKIFLDSRIRIPLYGAILFLGIFGASLWQKNNLGVRTPLPANNQLEFMANKN